MRAASSRYFVLVAVFVAMGLSVTTSSASIAPSFRRIGGYHSAAFGVSTDGQVVVGDREGEGWESEAFVWRDGASTIGLACESYASAVSGNGFVVVGTASSGAFKWTQAGGMVGLGSQATACGASGDGSVIVGSRSLSGGPEAVRWDLAGGMTGLGDLSGGAFYSAANAVSTDGTVIVGGSSSANSGEGSSEAFKLTKGTGMVGLGDLPGGGFASDAQAVSADGSVIVGYGTTATGMEAFRWTQNTGMVGLGHLPGGSGSSQARGVSADGTTVVGWTDGAGAFIWDATHGMRSLDYLLRTEFGLHDGPGQDAWAMGVSADGLTIVGYSGTSGNTSGWIATMPEPATFALLALGGLLALRRRR